MSVSWLETTEDCDPGVVVALALEVDAEAKGGCAGTEGKDTLACRSWRAWLGKEYEVPR